VRKAIEGITTPVFYQRLECALAGDGYDLCPYASAWPFLTDPHEHVAYRQCQTLAREARGNGAKGLATMSARRPEGVNSPVFARDVLSDPKIVGTAVVTPRGGSRIDLDFAARG
jgi:hypothetical protein